LHKDDLVHNDEYDNECLDFSTSQLEVIASIGLSNTSSLNIFDIEYSINNRLLCAVNDNKPQWLEIGDYEDDAWHDKGLEDSLNAGVEYNGTVYFIDEMIRV
jgi:hypothetical protein